MRANEDDHGTRTKLQVDAFVTQNPELAAAAAALVDSVGSDALIR